jgi:transcription antitermination factor NusG
MVETIASSDSDNRRSWFAVQAKTTHEKRVVSLLTYQNYECFLPVYACRRRWSDRIKEVELPLFPGYVFCRFQAPLRGPILRTPSVTGIVGIGGKPLPIDDAEIAAIELANRCGAGMRPHPFLQTGQYVRIEGGSLAGLEGIILDTRRRNRLIVSVTLLQRSVAVEIDSAWVTPIQTPGHLAVDMKPLWSRVS